MSKNILPQSRAPHKVHTVLSPQTREFLFDLHYFTKKWPIHKIGLLPEINITRQTIFNISQEAKKKEESK